MTRKIQKQMVRNLAKEKGLKFIKNPGCFDDNFYTTHRSSISVKYHDVLFFFFDDLWGNGIFAENDQCSGYSFDFLFATLKSYLSGRTTREFIESYLAS